jgi:hypothetical protein
MILLPSNVRELLAFRPFWYVAAGLLILAIVLYLASGNGTKEIDLNRNIGVIDGNANVKELIANEKANITNQTLSNLNTSINRDSGTFSGNTDDAFCRAFCRDGSCAEWRKSHECR